MRSRRIVVVGASSGGIMALRELTAGLSPEFEVPMAVVIHTAPDSPGILADLLDRAGPLRAVQARDAEPLTGGRIFVAPPDCHLLIEPGRVRVRKGPRENRFRPAIDPLFRSAAQVYGPGAIGVILTGNLDDGTAGMWAIKQLGGTTVVQDPAEAMFPSMPRNVLMHVDVDHVAPLAKIAPLLAELAASEPDAVPTERVVSMTRARERLKVEVEIAAESNALAAGLEALGQPSIFACPDCHGVLLAVPEGGRLRFRCHTGHAYSSASLMTAIDEGVDTALWMGVCALEEGAILAERMREHLRTAHPTVAGQDDLLEQSRRSREQSESIRQFINERHHVRVTDEV